MPLVAKRRTLSPLASLGKTTGHRDGIVAGVCWNLSTLVHSEAVLVGLSSVDAGCRVAGEKNANRSGMKNQFCSTQEDQLVGALICATIRKNWLCEVSAMKRKVIDYAEI